MDNQRKSKVWHRDRNPWNMAIREAKRHLALTKHKTERLEKVIENWTKLRNDGMPWPGEIAQLEESTTQN